ncbi:MAG: MASE1 domain-containing protein [Xanthobacteraceae bacterium]|jgi:PAS domain S-box-containing protein
MNRAGTGEGKFTALFSVPNAARYVLELAIVAAGYAGLAEAGQMLPSINLTATPLWPPTGLGLALALFLLRGYRIWPAILLGSFFSSEIAARSFLASGFVGAGTLLAALAGAWLIDRWSNGRKTFETPLGVARFALVSFVPPAMMTSGIVTVGLFLTNDASFDNDITWATWWLADATGILVIAPVIVLWATTPLRPFSKWSLLETAAILILATAIGVTAFSPLVGSSIDVPQTYQSLFGFFILLPLMWAGLCGNQRNAATVAFIFCGIAVWGLSIGSSPLPNADLNGSILLLFALSTSVSLSALALSAAMATRRDTETRLLLAQDQLNRQLAQTNLALESSRRDYQILIEGVVDYAIFLLDTAGRVASWNSAAKQIIGYTSDEIVGKHFGIFYRPDERRAGEPKRALELAIQRGKHEVEGWRIRKNGTPFFVTGSVSSILDNDGNLIGFANVIRDATERRDAQEKLVQAREQLAMAQKMEAIGKLTGGIAHDFNNLLMIIGGNAQTFKRLLDPKLPRAIEAIQTAAKRGESLTRQLLTFARRQHLSPTVVDLNACISDMRTMIESSLRGNIVYKEVNDPGVWPVKVDLAELELAIVNIAVNARDAMPNGGTFSIAMGNVTTEDAADVLNNEFVAIQFSDTGTGIPPDLLTKIFDPFFTTKEVGKGTGLGLSQVYGFAHQAGGLVKADSKVGQGTTLTIYLPALPAGEIASEDLSALDIQPSQRPAVLIVDDSAEVAEVTSSLFEHLGYDTLYRESADAALKLLADGTKIDLVFSDIVMPGTIDGVGLASEIRSQYPHLPVVLTTGYSEAARAAPADLRILRKPFDSDALRGFIQDAMAVN